MRLPIVVLALALLTPTVASAADGSLSPEQQYELAMKRLKRGLATKALEDLQRIRNYHRDDPASLKAELAIADLHFKRKEWEQARLAYEDFVRLHPRHPQMDYVRFRLGLAVFKRAPTMVGRDQSATRQALDTWSSFEQRFPESEHVPEVKRLSARAMNRLAGKELHIAKFYIRRGSWRAARGRATDVIEDYATSRYVPDALVMLGVALHRTGNPDLAAQARERLAAEFPTSRALARLDRKLARPPGEQVEEPVFVRPYRSPAMQ